MLKLDRLAAKASSKFAFEVGVRVSHPKRGNGTVAALEGDGGKTRVNFDSGESHAYDTASAAKLTELDDNNEPMGGELEWPPWGSDKQIVAAMKDLLNGMARAATLPPLQWEDPWAEANAIVEASVQGGSNPVAAASGIGARMITSIKALRSMWAKKSHARHSGDGSPVVSSLLIVCGQTRGAMAARLLQGLVNANQNEGGRRGSALGRQWRAEIGSVEEDMLIDEVSRADAVLFVQMAGSLSDTAVLVQLYEAVRCELPVLCVAVADSGYDFSDVVPSLERLEARLTVDDFALLRRQAEALQPVERAIFGAAELARPALIPCCTCGSGRLSTLQGSHGAALLPCRGGIRAVRPPPKSLMFRHSIPRRSGTRTSASARRSPPCCRT